MIEIGPEIITVVMLSGVFLGIISGFPIAFVLGGFGLIVGYMVFGDAVSEVFYSRVVNGMLLNYTLLAVPLFIYMGLMLERAGITGKLYDSLYALLGRFRGGLAIVTVLIGTIMAATVGIISASITMLTVVALPSMIKRGYDKRLASGAICAGGTLGILIPPSIMLVLYGPMAEISVGKLFFAAFIPGLVLSGLYISYIAIHSLLQPTIAPCLTVDEIQASFFKKATMLASALLPTAFLVLAVLGSIFFGVAPPTEAAGIGAFASVILAVAYRQFKWRFFYEVSLETLKFCGFIMAIAVMAFAFVGVFIAAGAGDVVREVIMSTPGGKWEAFAVIMFILFILGMFIDWIGILFIMVPIVTPIGTALGFDPLWFAVMICVNLQMSFLTPPFAYAIFIVRGAADPKLALTTNDIMHGVIPFVIAVMVGLTILVIFPQLILWLPAQMIE